MGICFSSSDGASPAARQRRPVKEWTPSDVQDYLRGLGLGHLVEKFEENAVCGQDLLTLTDEDFMEQLGCSPLQVRKIRSNLPKGRPAQQAPRAPPPPAPAYAPPTITPLAPAPAPYPAAPTPPQFHAPPPVAVPYTGPGAPPVVLAPVPLAPTVPAFPAAPINPAVPAPPVAVAPAPAAEAQPPAAAPEAAAEGKAGGAAPEDKAVALERAALDLRTKAAEAQQHSGTYGQANALLHQAEGKLHGAIRSLSVTGMSSAMAMGRNIAVAASGVRGPRRRMMMRGGPAQNIIEIATVRRADEAVKSAANDIAQARTLIPTIPYIQEAMLRGARQGVFLGLLAPSVTAGVIQASRVRQGLSSVERMYTQVQQARDWVARNHHTFQAQATHLHAQAGVKQAEAEALRRAAA